MSKFGKGQSINERGSAILRKTLAGDFFMQEEWGPNDNYPDIDGEIRLRDGKDTNLSKYLHYQLKSKEKLKSPKYSCSKKDLLYLTDPESNVPTLLFVVDVEKEKVYWFFAKKDFHEDLSTGEKSFTLDLTDYEITGNLTDLQKTWAEFAKTSNYDQVSESLKKIITDFTANVIHCVGLLYLVQRIPKLATVEVFKKLLNISEADTKQIIEKLLQEGVITGTENLYIVENKRIGVESTFELFKKLEPSKILEVFEDREDKKAIIRKMAEVKHPKAEKFLRGLLSEVTSFVDKPTTNDELFHLLELVEEFSYRFPKEILVLVGKLIKSKPVPPAILHKFTDRNLYGKDHDDLLKKSVELIKDIRYFKLKETLDLLISFTRGSNKEICSLANNAIKQLAEYNYHILLRAGYQPQLFLVDEINKWGKNKLYQNRDSVLTISGELLDPSFEGTTWDNRDTLTMHSGPLNANKSLRKIRSAAIQYLFNLFSTSKDLEEKKVILGRIQGAARTPDHAGASEELYKLIHDDAETIIKFYDTLLDSGVELELLKEIEEDSYWLGRWNKGVDLKGLSEVRLKIASNTEFALFRVFVGYDAHLARDADLNETKDTRQESIQKFVQDISFDNFPEWKKKILKVLKNYKHENHGEYLYLGKFLYHLGLKKPSIALKFATEIGDKLDHWLTDLIAGILQSDSKNIKPLIKGWIRKGKNLTNCIDALGYEHEPQKIDFEIASLVLVKALKTKNKEALRSVVRISFNNYSKNRELKKLFLRAAQELTKMKDTWWLHGMWARGESILDVLTKKESEVILSALMLLSNLDYHGEQILAPIAKRYPKQVIGFFLTRVSSKANRRAELESNFRAIPYDLHGLVEPLRAHEATVLPLILEWYGMGGKKNNWLYRWEASHFIEKIFSKEFSEMLTLHLISFVRSNDRNKLNIVLSILEPYQDGQKIWGVCKEIIKSYSAKKGFKETKNRLLVMLSATGVVTGEDGFVRAFEAMRTDAQKFIDDGSSAVIEFKKEYTEYLTQRIEYEKKRVDEQLALRDRGLR